MIYELGGGVPSRRSPTWKYMTIAAGFGFKNKKNSLPLVKQATDVENSQGEVLIPGKVFLVHTLT